MMKKETTKSPYTFVSFSTTQNTTPTLFKSKTFIDYVESKSDKLAEVVVNQVAGWSKIMDNFDYRADKSDFLCRDLDDMFSHLVYDGINGTKGYDMRYNKVFNISLKSMKNLFQRASKRNPNTLTKAKDIVLRNKLGGTGEHTPTQEEYFDYLLAIQTGFDKHTNTYQIRLGVATFSTVSKHIIDTEGDQVKCNLANDDWDYLSKLYVFKLNTEDVNTFEERKTDIYNTFRSNVAIALRQLGAAHISEIEE